MKANGSSTIILPAPWRSQCIRCFRMSTPSSSVAPTMGLVSALKLAKQSTADRDLLALPITRCARCSGATLVRYAITSRRIAACLTGDATLLSMPLVERLQRRAPSPCSRARCGRRAALPTGARCARTDQRKSCFGRDIRHHSAPPVSDQAAQDRLPIEGGELCPCR